MPKQIHYYVTENGRAPFFEWLDEKDIKTQVVIHRYIQRVSEGGAKKSVRALKGGIFEIKIPFAPGLRVYFAELGNKSMLLLLGGDKRTQIRDIRKAQVYWRNYGK